MPYELITIPCRSDNYAFLLRDHASGETLLVDVPAAAPILATLAENAWSLTHILLTHHHDDHVAGLADVLAAHPAQVIGAAADQHRLPSLNRAVVAGDTLAIGSQRGRVMDVPGHTVGHIAVYFEAAKLLFSAGRLRIASKLCHICSAVPSNKRPQPSAIRLSAEKSNLAASK